MTTEDEKTAKMRERVEALLMKAASTEFAEEAETFTAKAHELMLKWSIDEASLRSAGDVAAETLIDEIDLSSNHWRENVAVIAAIGRAFSVKVIARPYQRGGRPAAILVGVRDDVEFVKQTYASLSDFMKVAQRRHISESMHGEAPTPKEARQHGSAFRLGFASRIGKRLEESHKSTVEEAVAQDANLLPVLAAKDVVVQAAYDEAFPRTKQMRGSRVSDRSAYAAGQAAANGAVTGPSLSA